MTSDRIATEDYVASARSRLVAANAAGIPFGSLKLWLDSADSTTLTISGGTRITEMLDLSGGGHDFVETSGSGPTLNPSSLNNLGTATFDGSQYLGNADREFWRFLHEGPSTVFIVAESLSAVSGRPTYFGNNSYAAPPVYGYSLATPGLQIQVAADAYSILDAGVSFGDGAFHVISIKADPTNGTTGSRTSISLDGTSPVAGNTYSGSTTTGHDSGDDLFLGKSGAGYTTGLHGAIAELIVFEGTLSDGAIASVNSYLLQKWFDQFPAGEGPLVTSVNGLTGDVTIPPLPSGVVLRKSTRVGDATNTTDTDAVVTASGGPTLLFTATGGLFRMPSGKTVFHDAHSWVPNAPVGGDVIAEIYMVYPDPNPDSGGDPSGAGYDMTVSNPGGGPPGPFYQWDSDAWVKVASILMPDGATRSDACTITDERNFV